MSIVIKAIREIAPHIVPQVRHTLPTTTQHGLQKIDAEVMQATSWIRKVAQNASTELVLEKTFIACQLTPKIVFCEKASTILLRAFALEKTSLPAIVNHELDSFAHKKSDGASRLFLAKQNAPWKIYTALAPSSIFRTVASFSLQISQRPNITFSIPRSLVYLSHTEKKSLLADRIFKNFLALQQSRKAESIKTSLSEDFKLTGEIQEVLSIGLAQISTYKDFGPPDSAISTILDIDEKTDLALPTTLFIPTSKKTTKAGYLSKKEGVIQIKKEPTPSELLKSFLNEGLTLFTDASSLQHYREFAYTVILGGVFGITLIKSNPINFRATNLLRMNSIARGPSLPLQRLLTPALRGINYTQHISKRTLHQLTLPPPTIKPRSQHRKIDKKSRTRRKNRPFTRYSRQTRKTLRSLRWTLKRARRMRPLSTLDFGRKAEQPLDRSSRGLIRKNKNPFLVAPLRFLAANPPTIPTGLTPVFPTPPMPIPHNPDPLPPQENILPGPPSPPTIVPPGPQPPGPQPPGPQPPPANIPRAPLSLPATIPLVPLPFPATTPLAPLSLPTTIPLEPAQNLLSNFYIASENNEALPLFFDSDISSQLILDNPVDGHQLHLFLEEPGEISLLSACTGGEENTDPFQKSGSLTSKSLPFPRNDLLTCESLPQQQASTSYLENCLELIASSHKKDRSGTDLQSLAGYLQRFSPLGRRIPQSLLKEALSSVFFSPSQALTNRTPPLSKERTFTHQNLRDSLGSAKDIPSRRPKDSKTPSDSSVPRTTPPTSVKAPVAMAEPLPQMQPPSVKWTIKEPIRSTKIPHKHFEKLFKPAPLQMRKSVRGFDFEIPSFFDIARYYSAYSAHYLISDDKETSSEVLPPALGFLKDPFTLNESQPPCPQIGVKKPIYINLCPYTDRSQEIARLQSEVKAQFESFHHKYGEGEHNTVSIIVLTNPKAPWVSMINGGNTTEELALHLAQELAKITKHNLMWTYNPLAASSQNVDAVDLLEGAHDTIISEIYATTLELGLKLNKRNGIHRMIACSESQGVLQMIRASFQLQNPSEVLSKCFFYGIGTCENERLETQSAKIAFVNYTHKEEGKKRPLYWGRKVNTLNSSTDSSLPSLEVESDIYWNELIDIVFKGYKGTKPKYFESYP